MLVWCGNTGKPVANEQLSELFWTLPFRKSPHVVGTMTHQAGGEVRNRKNDHKPDHAVPVPDLVEADRGPAVRGRRQQRARAMKNFLLLRLIPTVKEILQLRILERILVEYLAVSMSQEIFGKASDVLIGDPREGCPITQTPHIKLC